MRAEVAEIVARAGELEGKFLHSRNLGTRRTGEYLGEISRLYFQAGESVRTRKEADAAGRALKDALAMLSEGAMEGKPGEILTEPTGC